MQMVKEAENEGYCDVSGRAEALDAIGTGLVWSYFVLSEQRT